MAEEALNLHYPFQTYPSFDLKALDREITEDRSLFLQNAKKLMNFIQHNPLSKKDTLVVFTVGSFQDDIDISRMDINSRRYLDMNDTILPSFITFGFLLEQPGKSLFDGINNLEVVLISPSRNLKDGIPYYISRNKNTFQNILELGTETQSEDEYSKFVLYTIRDEGMEINIRFRWFYMPFVNRSDDIKVFLPEINDREIYINNKFSKYIQGNEIVSKSDRDYIVSQINQQYATQADIDFVNLFTDKFMDFYKSYNFKPIVVNNAIFINQPIRENYFISNIDKRIREIGFGNNVLHYAKDNFYIINKVSTYWLVNDLSVEGKYTVRGCRGYLNKVFLDKDNKIDLTKLCSSNVRPSSLYGGKKYNKKLKTKKRANKKYSNKKQTNKKYTNKKK